MKSTTPDPSKKLLTVDEAADRLSLSVKTVYKLVGGRELEHIRVGRAIRIHPDALAAYMEDSTVEVLPIEELG